MNDRNNEFDKLIEEYTKKAKVTTERNNELDILTMCHSFSNALRDNNNANEASVKEAKEQIKETEEQITASDIANKIINDAIKQQTDELNEILDKEKILLKTDNNELANLLYEHKKAYLIRINELVSIIRKGLEDLNLALTNSNSQLDEYLGKYELNKDRFNKTIENVLTRAQDILEIEDNKVLISENDASEEEKENTILETANNKEETAEIDTETKTADPEALDDNTQNIIEEASDETKEDASIPVVENLTDINVVPDQIIIDEPDEVVNESPINNEEVVATNDESTEVVSESPIKAEEIVITNDKPAESIDSYKATSDSIYANGENETVIDTKVESEPLKEEIQRNWVKVTNVIAFSPNYGVKTPEVTDTTEFKEENKPVDAIQVEDKKEPEFVSENTELINLDGLNSNSDQSVPNNVKPDNLVDISNSFSANPENVYDISNQYSRGGSSAQGMAS